MYRGSKIPALRGEYVYSDYCESTLRAIKERDGKLAGQRDLGAKGNQIIAFGQDQDGELYVLSQGEDSNASTPPE